MKASKTKQCSVCDEHKPMSSFLRGPEDDPIELGLCTECDRRITKEVCEKAHLIPGAYFSSL